MSVRSALLLAATLLVVALFASGASAGNNFAKFSEFQKQFNKYYSTEDFVPRYRTFIKNLQEIAALNEAQNNEMERAEFGITPFSDMTKEEFANQYLVPSDVLQPMIQALQSDEEHKFIDNGPKTRAICDPTPTPVDNTTVVVDKTTAFDWRQSGKNVITPIYNQGGCGSCWAFAAAENTESMWALSGRALVGLSAQQILDCDNGNSGCAGGWPTRAYNYIKNTGGLMTAASYPYTGRKSTCRFSSGQVAAKISSWVSVTTSRDENAMADFVANRGPIAVCLDSSIWQNYRSGVITTSSGCGTNMNHCVMVTGYNVTSSGMKIWNVRNQWGSNFGEKGYLRIQRGSNVCGIAQAPSSVVV